MGSKRRISKELLEIILKNRTSGQYYVEPFVGGGNMIENVTGNRIGSDFFEPVIKALTFVRDDIKNIPKNNTEFTESDYNNAKNNPNPTNLECYALFSYSFMAKYRGGWARSRNRDIVKESVRNNSIQSNLIQGVDLRTCSYDALIIPDNSIIYCDPPYENAAGYKTGSFNHKDFWQWCRDKTIEGHEVFISEYNAPSDFTEVWCKTIINNGNDNKAIEKLFKYEIR